MQWAAVSAHLSLIKVAPQCFLRFLCNCSCHGKAPGAACAPLMIRICGFPPVPPPIVVSGLVSLINSWSKPANAVSRPINGKVIVQGMNSNRQESKWIGMNRNESTFCPPLSNSLFRIRDFDRKILQPTHTHTLHSLVWCFLSTHVLLMIFRMYACTMYIVCTLFLFFSKKQSYVRFFPNLLSFVFEHSVGRKIIKNALTVFFASPHLPTEVKTKSKRTNQLSPVERLRIFCRPFVVVAVFFLLMFAFQFRMVVNTEFRCTIASVFVFLPLFVIWNQSFRHQGDYHSQAPIRGYTHTHTPTKLGSKPFSFSSPADLIVRSLTFEEFRSTAKSEKFPNFKLLSQFCSVLLLSDQAHNRYECQYCN